MPRTYVTLPSDVRPIPGFPGYMIRDGGEVYSCWHHCYGMTDRWHIKSAKPDENGRLMVRLKVGHGKHRLKSVHRLVLLAFVGPCPLGMVACHNDGNCINNLMVNLRWDTPENNEADKLIHGTIRRGEQINTTKLTVQQIPEIFRLAKAGMTIKDIAEAFGISATNVGQILRRESWAHIPIDADLLDVRLGCRRGEDACWSKLNESQVIEVFRMRAEGMTQREIGEAFNISQGGIGAILRRENWGHVIIPDELLPSR